LMNRRERDRRYQARRRAEGRAWDQQLENLDRVRERKRAHYRKRVERTYEGQCFGCGQPKLSEWYCWDCLSKKEDARIEETARRAGAL
jgi:hypothetical protein